MKKLLILTFLSILSSSLFSQYSVSGGLGTPYAYSENLGGSGIEKVYLLNTLSNATISYSSSSSSATFYRYKTSLSEKEQVPASDISYSSLGETTTYTISNLQDTYGYLAEERGGTKAAIWIIDYNAHQPLLTSIATIESDDRCENLKLFITKSDELSFYTVGGVKKSIPRRYSISYNDLKWDETTKKFNQELTILSAREIGTEVIIDAPLINTQFKLRGDQFAEHFKIAKEIVSNQYNAVAVDGHIDMINELGESIPETEKLSAPYTAILYGFANEPVTSYYTWFIYNKKDMKNPVARYTDKDIKYTFEQSGNYSIQLEVANNMSTCVDTLSVGLNISESDLQVPNYFSPDDSPGINDEFRVLHKSLIKFKCTIFNRWGVKLYEWTDPTKGWDGKYGGKYVSTGVYYYAIEALGSDGIKYKKGGDINILRKR